MEGVIVEVFAALVALIPIVIFFIFYVALIGLGIWIVVVFLKRQRERNEALEKIAKNLEKLQWNKDESNEK